MATCFSQHTEVADDQFKGIYKHFKRRDKPLNTQGVIDFSKLSEESKLIVRSICMKAKTIQHALKNEQVLALKKSTVKAR